VRETGDSFPNEFFIKSRASVLAFDEEAGRYCEGISDAIAQRYAVDYARMLQRRLQGLEEPLPRISGSLFEPHRKLIRSTLERMFRKHSADLK
jgi:hypothetical protein